MRYSEILLEYDVINTQDISDYLLYFINNAHHKNAKKWFKKTLRNHLINDARYLRKFEYQIDTLPDWAKDKDPNELWIFIVTQELRQQLPHLVDYFNDLGPQGSINMSVEQAIDNAERWTHQLIKRASDAEDEEGLEEIMKWKNGFRIVKLNSEQCLDREGKLMQHCVGSYAQQIQGSTKIYSLRDPNNKPHVTIEVRGKDVHQIKGKENKPPVKKYRAFVRKFISKFKLNPLHDIGFLGFIRTDEGKLYDIDNLPRKIIGDLYLDGLDVTILPENFHVTGNLSLNDTPLTELPKGLRVDKLLNIEKSNIKEIKDDVKIGRRLTLGENIIKLPKKIRINHMVFGSISPTVFNNTDELQTISGLLIIVQDNNTIKRLPKKLKIGEDFFANHLKINKFAEKMNVGRNLSLKYSEIDKLPDNLKIGGSMDISKSNIKELPKELHVNETLIISDTDITKLPDGLYVGEDLIHTIKDIEINDTIHIGGTARYLKMH